eukprot:3712035-Pyramimonas_sp.AAC.1
MRLDRSAECHLRVPGDSALVEITRTAPLDATGCIGNVMGRVGGNAHCDYNTTTATPWMSFTKATCMISSLFTRNTAVQERIRGLPDHLNATVPGSGRKCHPTDLATQVLGVEWMMLHNDWSKVGSAMLGQWSQDT